MTQRAPGSDLARILDANGAVGRSGRFLKPSKVGCCWPACSQPGAHRPQTDRDPDPAPTRRGVSTGRGDSDHDASITGRLRSRGPRQPAQLASRAVFAIEQLNSVLHRVRTGTLMRLRPPSAGIAMLLDRGGADAAREEQGLDVARGLADQQANTDKIYIPNGLSHDPRGTGRAGSVHGHGDLSKRPEIGECPRPRAR